jgi:DNA-binding response OmpR family regulator
VARIILIVDDERALADTLCAILIHAGYQAFAAYNSAEAQAVLASTRVDLLISDVMMPGMNGFDLAVFTSANYPETAILRLSGNAATQEIVAKGGAEHNHFTLLAKPIAPRQMLAYIDSIFNPLERTGTDR